MKRFEDFKGKVIKEIENSCDKEIRKKYGNEEMNNFKKNFKIRQKKSIFRL